MLINDKDKFLVDDLASIVITYITNNDGNMLKPILKARFSSRTTGETSKGIISSFDRYSKKHDDESSKDINIFIFSILYPYIDSVFSTDEFQDEFDTFQNGADTDLIINHSLEVIKEINGEIPDVDCIGTKFIFLCSAIQVAAIILNRAFFDDKKSCHDEDVGCSLYYKKIKDFSLRIFESDNSWRILRKVALKAFNLDKERLYNRYDKDFYKSKEYQIGLDTFHSFSSDKKITIFNENAYEIREIVKYMFDNIRNPGVSGGFNIAALIKSNDETDAAFRDLYYMVFQSLVPRCIAEETGAISKYAEDNAYKKVLDSTRKIIKKYL